MKKKNKKKLIKYVMEMAQQFEYQNKKVYDNLGKLNQALAEVCEHVGLDVNDDRRILKPRPKSQAASYKPVPPDAN